MGLRWRACGLRRMPPAGVFWKEQFGSGGVYREGEAAFRGPPVWLVFAGDVEFRRQHGAFVLRVEDAVGEGDVVVRDGLVGELL